MSSKQEKIEKTTANQHQDYKCEVCGTQGKPGCGYIDAHHVKHKSKGGSNTADNFEVLCSNCHRAGHQLVDLGTPMSHLTLEILKEQGELVDYGEQGKIKDINFVSLEPTKEHRQRLELLKFKKQ